MDALRRASAPLFYGLGLAVIIAIVLVQRGIAVDSLDLFLAVADLPLLLFGMTLGGSTLVTSLSRDKASPVLATVVFLPLIAAFAFFVYLNFALPFPQMF